MREYLGLLPPADPLHCYLRTYILPQLGHAHAEAEFDVFRLDRSRPVYLYAERGTGSRVVGKFLGPSYRAARPEQIRRMEREYDHLNLLRGYGLAGYPHEVVRPLGCNAELSALLVMDYVEGQPLSQILEAAFREGARDALFDRLTSLAYFLATLHNRTAVDQTVDFEQDCRYFDKLVNQLLGQGVLGADEAAGLRWQRDRWREQPRMWEDRQVLVHGDATPTNFFFAGGRQVTAIDLERVKRADRVFDVGRIAGELQHTLLQGTGNKYAAEPFIGHFLWEYACHFPDRERAFQAITARVPFHMAMTFLRIARNPWVSPWHRRRLIEEAKLTLRTP